MTERTMEWAFFRHALQGTCRHVLLSDGEEPRQSDRDDPYTEFRYCKEPAVGAAWYGSRGWRGFCKAHRPYDGADVVYRRGEFPA